jgi:hypothetical protein
MTTRFIITADLHQNIAKWRELVRVVEQAKPRFVLVAGDILPKEGGFNGQLKFFPVLAEVTVTQANSPEARRTGAFHRPSVESTSTLTSRPFFRYWETPKQKTSGGPGL